MNFILTAIMAVLSVLGFVELVRMMVFAMLKVSVRNRVAVLVKPQNPEECEHVIRCAAEKLKWLDFSEDVKLICLLESADEEMVNICEKLEKKYPFMTLLKC